MKLHNTYNRKKGFTLLEILVVIALFSLLIGIGLSFSFESYRGYIFRSEYTLTTNLIAKVRNRAVNNFDESAHGITINANEYRVYDTETYDVNNTATYESFPRNPTIQVEGATVIIFEQLTGNLDSCDESPCEVRVSHGLKVKKINVNDVGRIDW